MGEKDISINLANGKFENKVINLSEGDGTTYIKRVKTCAIAESPVANHRNRIGDVQGGKAAAAFERHIANGCNRRAKGDGGKRAATLERAHTNHCNGIGEDYGGQLAATHKGIVANGCHRAWNHNVFEIDAATECVALDIGNCVRNGDRNNSAVVAERLVANGCNSVFLTVDYVF